MLTHAHIDHFGIAIWFAKTHGTPVYCHADEVGHAKREYLEQASPVEIVKHVWQPRWLKWTAAIVRKGGLVARRHPDGAGADRRDRRHPARSADGDPDTRATPVGTARIVVDGVLVSGDALVTGHPLLQPPADRSCCPALFNHDQQGCVRSLDALGMLETEVLLPGHGPVWRGSLREAVQHAMAEAR